MKLTADQIDKVIVKEFKEQYKIFSTETDANGYLVHDNTALEAIVWVLRFYMIENEANEFIDGLMEEWPSLA